jgi:hypothetical protein
MRTLLFLSGFGSGGTDLTKNILNAHPDIHLFSELPNLSIIQTHGYNNTTVFSDINEVIAFRELLRNLHFGDDFEKIDYNLATELLTNELAKKGVLSLEEVLRLCLSTKDALVWGAKIPVWQVDVISELFPKAKFLIVTRDVRDVCLSWRDKWGKDMMWCSAKWAKRMHKGLEFVSKVRGSEYLILKFENILSEIEKICREICELLNIPFSDRMLNYHLYTERWDGKRNYGQPIISKNKEKWRHELNRKTVKRIEEISFDSMKLLGYTPEFATESKPISIYEKLRGVFCDSWAILFVGNRTLKQNTFGRRLATAFGVLRKLVLHIEQKK